LTNDYLDKIALKTLHDRPLPEGKPRGVACVNRPCNYAELGDLVKSGVEWELAWSEFLHEFFYWRQPGFFALPPPESFSPGYRALLAGTAEFLCEEFGLPIPIWVFDPQYTLDELWEPEEWMFPDDEEFRQRRIAKAHPAFLKRRVIFESRNLITL
jgi:hypothetical protein